MVKSVFLSVLFLAIFVYAPLPVRAACTSPAGEAGALEFFPGGGGCGAMMGGMTCNPLNTPIDSTVTGNSGACRAFCETYPTATCCEWSDGDGSCAVHDSDGTQPYSFGIYSEAADCSAFNPGSYKICDGTTWRSFIYQTMPVYESCSSAARIAYESASGSYKVCDGTDYLPIECVRSAAPTVTVTAKGAASDKTSISSWTALSGVSLNAGETLLVCLSTKGTVTGVTWNGQSLSNDIQSFPTTNGSAYIFSLSNVSAGTGNVIVNYSAAVDTGKALTASSATNLYKAAALDYSGANSGNGTAPSSLFFIGSTNYEEQLLFGCINTNGPVEDAAGTWSNSFTGGQRTGSTGGVADTNNTASEGYYQVSLMNTYWAEKSGVTSRNWGASMATYRVDVPCQGYGACFQEGAREYSAGSGMRWCKGGNWQQMLSP